MFKIDDIPLDDKKTWDLICSGNTLGVFQFDSYLGRHWCKVIQPRTIDQLSDIAALIRPGCLNAKTGNPLKSMTQKYADRKHGKEPVESYHPALDSILGNTYHIIVYQEDSMAIVTKLAGFDLNASNELRKAIGKKNPELMSKLEKQFVDGCKEVGLVEEIHAKEIFSWIRTSQKYAFNKSHSVSYAIMGFKTAYCKAHYVLEFYTAYLRGCRWKSKPRDSTRELIIDGRSNNIDFSPPNIRDLKIEPYIKEVGQNKYVSFGLSSIKMVGESARKKLLDNIKFVEAELSKPIDQWIWADILLMFGHKITKRPKLSSQICEALIFSGAFDCFGETRHKMYFDYEMYSLLTKGEQIATIQQHLEKKFSSLEQALSSISPIKKEGGGCHSAKRSEFVKNLCDGVANPSIALTDDPMFLAMSEEKYLGIGISCSKGDGLVQTEMSNYTCSSITSGVGTKNITLVAEIARFNVVTTAKKDKMAFVDIYDKTGGCEGCVIFPTFWKELQNVITDEGVYYFMCSRSKTGSLLIESAEKLI